MKRAIVTPATLAPAALAELKQWLGITTAQDDAALTALLRAALETCEAFTGMMPLETVCEEVQDVTSAWQILVTRPVQAITAVAGIDAAGIRTDLPGTVYAIELDADGGGRVQVMAPGTAQRLAITFIAGMAQHWDNLPDGLRHGIVRLAAHQHRERENGGASPLPPASVAALWRPWRRMRLA